MGNHSLFSTEEATLGRGRITSLKKQSNMRIGLVLLSTLMVLAFVEDASSDPRGLAEDRWGVHPPVVHYSTEAECVEYELVECYPDLIGGWSASPSSEADYRDDLVADDRKKGGSKCKKKGGKKCPRKKKGRR